MVHKALMFIAVVGIAGSGMLSCATARGTALTTGRSRSLSQVRQLQLLPGDLGRDLLQPRLRHYAHLDSRVSNTEPQCL